jgi:hypothetical protein
MVDWIPAVDGRRIAAGHPADDIADRRGAAERGALARSQTKLSKAVEEVAADLLAEIGGDRVVRPDQGLDRLETAIDCDVLGRSDLRHDCHRAGREGEGNLGAQSQGERFLPNALSLYAGHF